MELTLFRRRLALGKALGRLFCGTRAARRPAEPVTAPEGTRLTSDDQRPTTYDAVFGAVRCERPALTTPGQAGRGPRDAERSGPARGAADLRREWAVERATDESCRARPPILAHLLGLWLRRPASDSAVVEAGGAVTTVDAQPTEPTTSPSGGTIVGVHAAGPGVPRVPPPPQTPVVRLAQGPKRTTQQEAVVTALDPSSPDPRPPQAGVAALLPDADRHEPAARPPPLGPARRAT